MASNMFRGDGRPQDPFADPLDAILAEIAVSLQLPPGLHAKAVGRYEAVCRYIDRPGSPLEGRVSSLYPQGSMAIDATISTRGTDDEYDLDAVAEIAGGNEGPEALLDLLEAALVGYAIDRILQQAPRPAGSVALARLYAHGWALHPGRTRDHHWGKRAGAHCGTGAYQYGRAALTMILGIDAQIEAMMAIWPELSLVARDAQAAAWNGPVRPLLQTYRIGIVYRAQMVVENLDPRRLQPRVSILSPGLRPRPARCYRSCSRSRLTSSLFFHSI